MSESYVVNIAGANSVRNKIALLLNGAGDMPRNPILRGLGLAIDLKVSLDVLAFEAKLGVDTPPTDRVLAFSQVDTGHYRCRAAAGFADFGFNRDYSEAVAHYLGLSVTNPSHQVGTERLFWVKENPTIEIGWCSAQGPAWAAAISEAYTPSDTPGGLPTLAFDPGAPPELGIVPAAGSDDITGWVDAGEDRILELALYDENQLYPVDIPIRIMHTWRDEFDQKHFGGAKYVSIFEDGLAEDVQGLYLQNVNQGDVTTIDNIRILLADSDHEYRIVFRFRSELDDTFYVDKTIRFRILTADELNRQYTDTVLLDDMPDVTYQASSNEFFWSGMAASVAAFSWTDAFIIDDDKVIALPLDDSTAFSSSWLDIWEITYGGEIVIKFLRSAGFGIIESVYVTYKVTKPNGADDLTIVIEKVIFRRFIQSSDASFTPDVAFRLIEPAIGSTGTGGGDFEVFLEAINNGFEHEQVVAWTDKGSVSLATPIRNGQRYNISSIVDIDYSTGKVDQEKINLLLQTKNTTRVMAVVPVVPKPVVRSRVPAIGSAPYDDFVLPTITVDYPDLTIVWPSTTDQGESYSILGSASDGAGDKTVFELFGRKGAYAHTDPTLSPGDTIVLTGVLGGVSFNENSHARLHFRVQHTSGPVVNEGMDYFVDFPVWPGYDGTPTDGWHDGELKVILYKDKLVVVSKPANLLTVTLTGNLGTEVYGAINLLENYWYDISAVIDSTHTPLLLSYTKVDPDAPTAPPTAFGPFSIPRYTADFAAVTTQFANNPLTWLTARLTSGEFTLPKAKVDMTSKVIEFDYEDSVESWIKWEAVNPLDGKRLVFHERPPNRVERGIARLFRTDRPYGLQLRQRLLVVLLHADGPHVAALYPITGEFVAAEQLDNLRGLL